MADYCYNCGKIIVDNQEYCEYCGIAFRCDDEDSLRDDEFSNNSWDTDEQDF